MIRLDHRPTAARSSISVVLEAPARVGQALSANTRAFPRRPKLELLQGWRTSDAKIWPRAQGHIHGHASTRLTHAGRPASITAIPAKHLPSLVGLEPHDRRVALEIAPRGQNFPFASTPAPPS